MSWPAMRSFCITPWGRSFNFIISLLKTHENERLLVFVPARMRASAQFHHANSHDLKAINNTRISAARSWVISGGSKGWRTLRHPFIHLGGQE